MNQIQNWNKKRKARKKRREIQTKKKLLLHGSDILKAPGFVESKKYIQHGNISVHKHSLHVASVALMLSKNLPFKSKERDIVRGALLHDYFQYDWHDKPVNIKSILKFYRMHGFTHPATALKNAKRDFNLTKREKEIIRKHMWPLTINPPRCREAWIVTIADKYCSLKETLFLRK